MTAKIGSMFKIWHVNPISGAKSLVRAAKHKLNSGGKRDITNVRSENPSQADGPTQAKQGDFAAARDCLYQLKGSPKKGDQVFLSTALKHADELNERASQLAGDGMPHHQAVKHIKEDLGIWLKQYSSREIGNIARNAKRAMANETASSRLEIMTAVIDACAERQKELKKGPSSRSNGSDAVHNDPLITFRESPAARPAPSAAPPSDTSAVKAAPEPMGVQPTLEQAQRLAQLLLDALVNDSRRDAMQAIRALAAFQWPGATLRDLFDKALPAVQSHFPQIAERIGRLVLVADALADMDDPNLKAADPVVRSLAKSYEALNGLPPSARFARGEDRAMYREIMASDPVEAPPNAPPNHLETQPEAVTEAREQPNELRRTTLIGHVFDAAVSGVAADYIDALNAFLDYGDATGDDVAALAHAVTKESPEDRNRLQQAFAGLYKNLQESASQLARLDPDYQPPAYYHLAASLARAADEVRIFPKPHLVGAAKLLVSIKERNFFNFLRHLDAIGKLAPDERRERIAAIKYAFRNRPPQAKDIAFIRSEMRAFLEQEANVQKNPVKMDQLNTTWRELQAIPALRGEWIRAMPSAATKTDIVLQRGQPAPAETSRVNYSLERDLRALAELLINNERFGKKRSDRERQLTMIWKLIDVDLRKWLPLKASSASDRALRAAATAAVQPYGPEELDKLG